jgi:hypothetical protein
MDLLLQVRQVWQVLLRLLVQQQLQAQQSGDPKEYTGWIRWCAYIPCRLALYTANRVS